MLDSFTVLSKGGGLSPDNPACEGSPVKATVKSSRQGGRSPFDAVARHRSRSEENTVMPFIETIKAMKIIDIIRKQGGAKFPQDHD
jgi:hypothetical protein